MINIKLKTRLILTYLGTLAAALAIFLTISFQYLKNYDSPHDEYKMQNYCNEIAASVEQADSPQQIKAIIAKHKSLHQEYDFTFIMDNGQVVASTDPAYHGNLGISNIIENEQSLNNSAYGHPSQYKLIKYAPVSGSHKGIVIMKYPFLLTTAISTNLAPDFMIRIIMMLFLGLLLVILLPSLVFWLLSRRINRSISDFNESFQAIEQGDLNKAVHTKGGKEIQQVAASVNSMIESLAAARDREETLERARGDLFINISHDLKTPLSSIIGYADGIQQGLYDGQTDQALEVIQKKAVIMQKLIADLLDLSRLESGEDVLHWQQQDLAEVLRDQLAENYNEISKAGLELEALLPDHRCMIAMDIARINRVLDNLLSNAVKYGQDGQYMKVELTEFRYDYMVSIYTCGEEINDCEQIFERFYREEKSRSDTYGGHGLGLAICKAIIDRHGGTIGADRCLDMNRFFFTLRKGIGMT